MARSATARSDARMVHLRLDPEVHRRLRMIVAAQDTTMQDWLARIAEAAVDRAWLELVEGGVKS